MIEINKLGALDNIQFKIDPNMFTLDATVALNSLKPSADCKICTYLGVWISVEPYLWTKTIFKLNKIWAEIGFQILIIVGSCSDPKIYLRGSFLWLNTLSEIGVGEQCFREIEHSYFLTRITCSGTPTMHIKFSVWKEQFSVRKEQEFSSRVYESQDGFVYNIGF